MPTAGGVKAAGAGSAIAARNAVGFCYFFQESVVVISWKRGSFCGDVGSVECCEGEGGGGGKGCSGEASVVAETRRGKTWYEGRRRRKLTCN